MHYPWLSQTPVPFSLLPTLQSFRRIYTPNQDVFCLSFVQQRDSSVGSTTLHSACLPFISEYQHTPVSACQEYDLHNNCTIAASYVTNSIGTHPSLIITYGAWDDERREGERKRGIEGAGGWDPAYELTCRSRSRGCNNSHKV